MPALLAGRIDRRDENGVGAVEGRAEGIEQITKPREAVRLDDGDHPLVGRRTRRGEHRRDLHRVMPVVVEDLHAVPGTGAGEAPPHAGE